MSVRRWLIAIGAMTAAFLPSAASACDLDTFLFKLPGETAAQASERSAAIMADYSIYQHRDRESASLKAASAIYLAKVLSRTPGGVTENGTVLASATVQPLKSLKGRLPITEQKLTDDGATGMCDDVGDGHGSFAQVGELVVVFTGLKPSNYRSRGTDSFRVSEIRTIELLDKLRELGESLE